MVVIETVDEHERVGEVEETGDGLASHIGRTHVALCGPLQKSILNEA